MVRRIDDFLAGVSPEQKEQPYNAKRGKTFAPNPPAWNAVDGMGRKHDPEQAKKLLDEALK